MNTIKNIILVVAIIVIGLFSWEKINHVKPEPVIVTLPAKEGSSKVIIEEIVIRDTIKDTIFLKSKDKIIVDKKYKELYEQTKDSLERQALYLQAIQIRNYDKVFLDNDTIKITGSFTTRGSLLNSKVNYFIKESKFTYTPQVRYEMPRLGFGIGGEVSTEGVFKGNFLVTNRSNIYSASYTTDGVFWLGFNKHFKIY